MLTRYALLLMAPLFISSTMANQSSADVVSVKVTGQSAAYRFSVRIASPDIGCEQYADWWEIVSADGALLYRRILAHSHVDENPFTRSSLKALDLDPDATLFIRAHMNNSGYGGVVWGGTINSGFTADNSELELPDLSNSGPQPNRCHY